MVHAETELKLSVPSGFELPDLGNLDDSIHCGESSDATLRAFYWDSADLRLTRHGHSLRYREQVAPTSGTVGTWTLKLRTQIHRKGPLVSREELVFAGQPGQPPPEAEALIAGVLRGSPLVMIATLQQLRRSMTLSRVKDGEFDVQGELIAPEEIVEVDLDQVTAEVTNGSNEDQSLSFCELELELLTPRGEGHLPKSLVRVLRRAGAEKTDGRSKLARVLGPSACAPEVLVPRIRNGSTAGEFVQSVFGRGFEQLLDVDPHVRLGEDAEAIHVARVAARRLRADLSTLAPLLDSSVVGPLKMELQWFGQVLGRGRDLEVLAKRLQAETDKLPDPHRAAGQTLVDLLSGEGANIQDGLREAMESPRYFALLESLLKASAQPPFAADADVSRRASDALLPLVRGSVRRVFRHVKTARAEEGGEQCSVARIPEGALHETRKRAKRARYACDLGAPLLGHSLEKLAGRFEAIQEVLGQFQDATVSQAWLSAPRGTPELAFVAGILYERELLAERRARSGFSKVWEKFEKDDAHKG